MTSLAPKPPFIAAKHHGGSQTPKLIVIHSTVGPTRLGSAKAVAYFFSRETKPTSAHYVVDAGSVYQCVGDHTVAYHCGYNQDSIGIELCDYPTTRNARRWKDADHKALFRRGAKLTAQLCVAYNIRPYYVSARALKAGKKGVTTHAQMSSAFQRSSHWDPGSWPRFRFMVEVRRQVRLLKKQQR